MRKTFLPFSVPQITEEEIAAVGDVLRSGWITTGPRHAEFEQAFRAYCGCGQTVALASATAGMHVLLKALNIGPGDEVITPSLTWVSTANLVALSGAKPVFAEVDRDTLMVTRETVAPLITCRTKLIVPVHYAGAPCDLDPLRALAAEKNIPFVEDAAHAAGTRYKGRLIGAEGAAIFSFHPIKNMTTGEGGMFTTQDAALADRVRSLKFHGLGVDAYDRQTHGRSPQAQVIAPGYKYNLTDIAAALGLGQLRRLEDMNARRRALARRYHEKLAGIPEIRPLAVPAYEHTHSWHLFIVRVDSPKIDRDTFMAELKLRNIGAGLHFRATHLQKYYTDELGCRRGMLPDTEWNSDRICSLPLFPTMTERDQDDVVAAIQEVLA